MLEIVLVIAAWRRGWKGWALIPSAIGYSLLFLAASSPYNSDISDKVVVVTIGVIGALLFMIARPRTAHGPSTSERTTLPPEPAR